MNVAKIHSQCWEAPGTYTACGLSQRNKKVTMDMEKMTCRRCRQIIHLLDKPTRRRPRGENPPLYPGGPPEG